MSDLTVSTDLLRPADSPYAARVATYELLRSGVTTICDLAAPRPDWVGDYEPTGIRAVLWGMFRSGPWKTRNGHSVEYDLDFALGDKRLRDAIDVADTVSKHPSGLFTGYFGPAQIGPVARIGIFEKKTSDLKFF